MHRDVMTYISSNGVVHLYVRETIIILQHKNNNDNKNLQICNSHNRKRSIEILSEFKSEMFPSFGKLYSSVFFCLPTPSKILVVFVPRHGNLFSYILSYIIQVHAFRLVRVGVKRVQLVGGGGGLDTPNRR